MPPGPKKRKANKKKKEMETTNPNPNSDPPPSTLPLLHLQENGQENYGSADETPTLHPDSTFHPQLENGSGLMVVEKFAVGSVENEDNPIQTQVETIEVHEKEAKIVPLMDEEEITVTVIQNKVFGSVKEVEDDSTKYYEVQDKDPEVLVELVVDPSSHEKEVKIVPWQDEKTRIDESLEDIVVVEKSLKENSNVTEDFVVDNVEYAVKEDSLKEIDSDEVAEESTLVGVTENHEVYVEEVDTTANEEPNWHSEATVQKLNKIMFGNVESLSPEKGVTDIVPQDTVRIEVSSKSEVIRGPLVVRRATLWNCCGLLDLVTGSQS